MTSLSLELTRATAFRAGVQHQIYETANNLYRAALRPVKRRAVEPISTVAKNKTTYLCDAQGLIVLVTARGNIFTKIGGHRLNQTEGANHADVQ